MRLAETFGPDDRQDRHGQRTLGHGRSVVERDRRTRPDALKFTVTGHGDRPPEVNVTGTA